MESSSCGHSYGSSSRLQLLKQQQQHAAVTSNSSRTTRLTNNIFVVRVVTLLVAVQCLFMVHWSSDAAFTTTTRHHHRRRHQWNSVQKRMDPSTTTTWHRTIQLYQQQQQHQQHPLQRSDAVQGSTTQADASSSSSYTETSSKRITTENGQQQQQQQQKTAEMSKLDSFKRRQLLFSMLVAACTTATSSTSAAEERPNTTTSTTVTTDATSDILNVYTDQDILKPPLDDRTYMTYTMASNQLRVLLCSDPSSTQVAAAMDVHVGACSDPDYLPGLAHFTEHMLFLGTQPYPDVNSFETFLSSNGGISNAFTDSENTVYYFDMQASDKLPEGLMRFASFFSAPLFTVSATDRELNAIESEHAKNLQSDTFRIYQMEKARANPKHPYSKFFTGNKATLLDNNHNNHNIDLRNELKQFYTKYYSANLMTLAIVAPQSLSTLQQMVDRACRDIPNHNNFKPELAWKAIPPFDPKRSIVPPFDQIVEIVPVADLRQVTIQWPIVYDQSTAEQDRLSSLLNKPSTYVAHLIGHEGPGSLLSYLKRQRYANSLVSSLDSDVSSFETFSVTVGLTTQGLAAVEHVVQAIYTYLEMIRTSQPIPDYIFQEVLQLDELEWRFLTKTSTAGYVQSMATAMQKYPPTLYVAGPRRVALTEPLVGGVTASSTTGTPTLTTKLIASSAPRSQFSSPEQLEYTKTLAMNLISKLTVDNMMVTVLSKTFENQADRVEPVYGTKYHVRPIPQDTLERWRNPRQQTPKQLGLAYPKPNVFIPSETGLQVRHAPIQSLLDKTSFEYRMQPIAPPVVIRDDDGDGRWTIYFKEDDRFGVPKAYIVFQLLTEQVYSSPLNAALGELYQSCVADRLEEYAYDAQLAGLTYDVKILPRGVRVTFGGYNDKLGRFASYITKKISKDVKAILPRDDAEFERYKDNFMRSLSAFDVRQPFAHAAYYATINLQPIRFQYSNAQMRDAARTTTLPDLVVYAKSLWKAGRGQALVQGNFGKDEALDLVNVIDKSLGFQTIRDSDVPPQLKPLPLPDLPKYMTPPRLFVAEPNMANGNSACHVMMQCLEPGEKDHVLIELVSAIVEEPFYADLRTKQQLGYIVSSGLYALGSTRTISFIVQSSVAPADELRIAIIKFLDSVQSNLLEPLSKGDLAVYTKSLIERKTEPDKELSTEVTRNWLEISSGRLQFDRVQREAAALLEVEKDDVLQFWDRLWGNGRRVLITEMIPLLGPASSPNPPTTTGYTTRELMLENGIVLGIDDIEKFRRDREDFSRLLGQQ